MLTTLFATVDARPLALARVVVGIAVLIRAVVTWSLLSRIAEPDVLVSPYVNWMPEPTMVVAVLVLVVWLTAGSMFMIGWRVALSGPILLATIVFSLVLDQQMYSNHLYLMAWLVLLLTLANAGAGLNIHRRERPVVRWPILLLMVQVSIVYGFSALTKLNAEYLSGRVLAGTLGTGLVPFPDSLRTPDFLSVVAAITIIVELFIAVFLWRTRFRPAAFVLGLSLHTSITLLMAGTLQLFVFSLEMLALYPLFLSREPLLVIWDDDCGWCLRWVTWFERLDVLGSLRTVGKRSDGHQIPSLDVEASIHLIHHERITRGFGAVTRIFEHLVPTLWFAPVLRLPGLRLVGQRLYNRQAARRACATSEASRPESSTAR